MSSPDLIEIQNLCSHYRERRVLHDVTCSIPRSSVTVVMGISGCGKTTLLRHIIGLKKTGPGQVFIEGQDLGLFSESELRAYRRRLGVLFQSGALFNSMTLAQNVAVPLEVHTRLPAETIRIMSLIKLNQVGLAEFQGYMPSQLSGGMKKRAGLARALSMDPEILFVDEPSSGLDPITAAGLDTLIQDLCQTLKMTILVVTHELESAFRIADHMIVMDQGRVLAAGTPEVIRASSNPRVVQFLNRVADEREGSSEAYLSWLLGGGKSSS